jgi:uroporphyrinogen decarboxylase
MIPMFEEKVLERRERTQIVQDWKGNICEIGNEYTVEYLRNAIDFVTRRWIECPVKTREDWEGMRHRYDVDDPKRFPSEFRAASVRLRERDSVVSMHISGPFWQMREWLGFENLMLAFHDDPGLLKDMAVFWEEFMAALLEKTFRDFVPDEVEISEDMAFKGFSMISPAMTREFLLPSYMRWGEIIRKAGCPIYSMDCDGFIGELIPIWMEAGMNATWPVEVAAGNDIVDFRRRFGRGMAYRGGVDKREVARGSPAIDDEIRRLGPVIEDGGFIPGCDHGVPSDISWPDFTYFVGLLADVTGWR